MEATTTADPTGANEGGTGPATDDSNNQSPGLRASLAGLEIVSIAVASSRSVYAVGTIGRHSHVVVVDPAGNVAGQEFLDLAAPARLQAIDGQVWLMGKRDDVAWVSRLSELAQPVESLELRAPPSSTARGLATGPSGARGIAIEAADSQLGTRLHFRGVGVDGAFWFGADLGAGHNPAIRGVEGGWQISHAIATAPPDSMGVRMAQVAVGADAGAVPGPEFDHANPADGRALLSIGRDGSTLALLWYPEEFEFIRWARSGQRIAYAKAADGPLPRAQALFCEDDGSCSICGGTEHGPNAGFFVADIDPDGNVLGQHNYALSEFFSAGYLRDRISLGCTALVGFEAEQLVLSGNFLSSRGAQAGLVEGWIVTVARPHVGARSR